MISFNYEQFSEHWIIDVILCVVCYMIHVFHSSLSVPSFLVGVGSEPILMYDFTRSQVSTPLELFTLKLDHRIKLHPQIVCFLNLHSLISHLLLDFTFLKGTVIHMAPFNVSLGFFIMFNIFESNVKLVLQIFGCYKCGKSFLVK
jgi:hypothetical protein